MDKGDQSLIRKSQKVPRRRPCTLRIFSNLVGDGGHDVMGVGQKTACVFFGAFSHNLSLFNFFFPLGFLSHTFFIPI